MFPCEHLYKTVLKISSSLGGLDSNLRINTTCQHCKALHTTLVDCSNSRGHIQGHYSATISERKVLLLLFPYTVCFYTYLYRETYAHTHTLPDGEDAVVMSGVTTGNAITAQTE